MVRSAPLELMRACDGSLEPSCYKNDHVMGNFRFARSARPQCAKMCFLLHKAPLTTGLRLVTLIWVTYNLKIREICVFYYIRHLLMTVLSL